MSKTLFKTTLFLIWSLAMAISSHAERNIEQPDYQVIKQEDGVELRRYAPYLAAEVTVEAGSRDQASSKGFRLLANYIFGGNKGANKIAMTAPVTTQPTSGTKIAMTAPVTTTGDGAGSYTVRFSMPGKWTLDTLPRPSNQQVKLIEVPAQAVVAHRFTGEKADTAIKASNEAVEAFAAKHGLELAAEPIVAGYDGPMTPTAKRRWEVMRAVVSNSN